MRKYLRRISRTRADRIGAKVSRFVAKEWDTYQIKKVGKINRRKNQAKGTHKRSTWGQRVKFAVATI